MHDENTPSPVTSAVVAVGALLAVCGVVWWLALLATGSDAATSVASTQRATTPDVTQSLEQEQAPMLTEAAPTVPAGVERRPVLLSVPVLFDDDLGTGSTEFSAVTLNEDTNRLVVADDEGQLFEFDLDEDGVPIVPPRRTITVQVGDSDIEGISWISGTTYVLAHEATGQLSVVEIEEGQQVVAVANLTRTIDTRIPEVDGSGIEGVSSVEALDDVEFIVAVERPPSLTFIDDDGMAPLTVPLRLGVQDIADVWASPDNSLWVVSDLGRVVVRLQLDADGTVRQLQQLDLVFGDGQFEQPEGLVVSRDGQRLYVVGESPGAGQFSLGVWWLR